jgi:copper(I)-binding protein
LNDLADRLVQIVPFAWNYPDSHRVARLCRPSSAGRLLTGREVRGLRRRRAATRKPGPGPARPTNHGPNGPVAAAAPWATVAVMHPRPRLLSVVVATVVAVGACSGAASVPTIAGAWARPAPVGGDTAAYLTITTGAGQADALLSASSPGAGTVQVHEVSTDASGMTGMHPIDRLDIPAGATVKLEPGGHHLMVMGVTSELAVGGKLELDLVFEHAGKVVVQAEIRQG